MIIRDDQGEVLKYRTMTVNRIFQANEPEAIGLLEAAGWLQQLQLQGVTIKLDAKAVHDAYHAKFKD